VYRHSVADLIGSNEREREPRVPPSQIYRQNVLVHFSKFCSGPTAIGWSNGRGTSLTGSSPDSVLLLPRLSPLQTECSEESHSSDFGAGPASGQTTVGSGGVGTFF
jgi:hypothetical protein